MTPVSFDEAFSRIERGVAPLGTETVPLHQAVGRILSDPVVAQLTMPRQDVSAMDGYALRQADASEIPFSLPVRGEVAAGAAPGQSIRAGSMMRIFTGAPVPSGADLVIVQENIARDGAVAAVVKPYGPGRHIRQKGSDFFAGDVLIEDGHEMTWKSVTTAAGADISDVQVYQRPRVAILATGDELAKPGAARTRPGAIPESVSCGVHAYVEAQGGEVVWKNSLPDEPEQLQPAASMAVDVADVVVVIGGASVGDRDYSRTIFGAELDYIFPKVAIKPGKPVWLARSGGRWVLGLPGNPTAALVTARLFLAPLLLGLSGGEPASTIRFQQMRLAGDLPATSSRECFVRARRRGDEAQALNQQDSSNQSALSMADLLIRRPANAAALKHGDLVSALEF